MNPDIAKEIELRIKKKMPRAKIHIVNESHLHAGHIGDNGTGQTHFKLKVESSDFRGISRVESHKIINTLLQDLFSEGLHALSLSVKCN